MLLCSSAPRIAPLLPHSPGRENRKDWDGDADAGPLPWQENPVPPARLPCRLGTRQRLDHSLAYFPCRRQPLMGEETAKQWPLVRCPHTWWRPPTQACPERRAPRVAPGAASCPAERQELPAPSHCWGQALLSDPRCQHYHLSTELLPQNAAEQREVNMIWALFSLTAFGCGKCCKQVNIDKKPRTIPEIFYSHCCQCL